MQPEVAALRNIVAIRLDNIGDVVMLSPALRALRATYPGARITLMASKAGAMVAPMLPWIDDVMTERVVWQDASDAMPLDPDRELALIERIRVRSFDAAFVFTSFSQTPHTPAYACYLAGVPIRVGESKEFGGSVLSHRAIPLPDDAHQVDRNLHLLHAAGIADAGPELELHPPEEAVQRAQALLRRESVDPERPYVVVAPGASCPSRQYDLARMAAVARLLHDRCRLPVVLIGGDRERDVVDALAANAGRGTRSIAGATTVPEMAAVIARAALVVSNNSGPLHIADAFGRPQLVLYSGTDMLGQWMPRHDRAISLRRDVDCSPCYAFDCRYAMECLDISPEQVVEVASSLLLLPD